MTDEAVDSTASEHVQNEDASEAEYDKHWAEFSGDDEPEYDVDLDASGDALGGEQDSDDVSDPPEGGAGQDASDEGSDQGSADAGGDALSIRLQELERENNSLKHKASSDAGRNAAFQRRISELEGQLKAQGEDTPAAELSLDEIPEDIRDLYDDKELAGILKIAEIVASKKAGQVESKVNSIEERTAKSEVEAEIERKRTQLSSFESALDDKFEGEDWRDLNTDPGFSEYLKQPHPKYGVPRKALFAAAYQNGNVGGVASFFKAYQQQKGGKPQSAAGEEQDSSDRRVNDRDERLRQAIETPTTPVGRASGPADDDYDALWDHFARQEERNSAR